MSFELFCQVANSFSKKCQDLFFLFLDDRWLGIRDVSCLAEVDIAQAHADRIPLDATTRENGESDSAVMRSGESELILVGLRVVTMSWLFCNCSWSRECLSVCLGPDPPCTANNGNILFFREPHPRSGKTSFRSTAQLWNIQCLSIPSCLNLPCQGRRST